MRTTTINLSLINLKSIILNLNFNKNEINNQSILSPKYLHLQHIIPSMVAYINLFSMMWIFPVIYFQKSTLYHQLPECLFTKMYNWVEIFKIHLKQNNFIQVSTAVQISLKTKATPIINNYNKSVIIHIYMVNKKQDLYF